MNDKIVCSKCNGAGCVRHYDDDGFWTEYCSACGGRGWLQRSVLKDDGFEDNGVTFDELVEMISIASNEMVTITKQEYEELLEYKRKYEWLSADAVSRDLLEQYKWERDIAIGQLEELGLGLGQKVEGVYLSNEEHEKMLEYKHMYEDLCD